MTSAPDNSSSAGLRAGGTGASLRAGVTDAVRVLRALSWLRWRTLVNTLDRSGRRDVLERFSRTIESLGPILLAVLAVPAFLAAAALGTFAGASLVSGWIPELWVAVRVALVGLLVVAVTVPFVAPGGRQLAGMRRLLLLPISRVVLYVTDAVAALTDPWTALAVPLVLAVPLGVAWSAGVMPGVMTLVPGILFVLVLIGAVSLSSTSLQLVARNRRRAELVTLIAMLILPMIGLLPSMMGPERRRDRQRRSPAAEQRQAPADAPPAWTQISPTEMYASAVSLAAWRRYRETALPLLGLVAWAAALHGATWLLFRRLYDSPMSVGARSSVDAREVRLARIPGLSPAAAAIAMAQVRLVLRSVRGRTCLVGPLLIFVIFGTLTLSRGDLGPMAILTDRGGIGLAVFVAFFSLLSMHPVVANQFAVDGAGLTLEFLQPISGRDLLRGKAVGGALASLAPAAVVLLLARVAFNGGTWGQWTALAFGCIATYALVAPLAATMSLAFPRAVNFNSMGRSSNPHQLATLITLLATALAAAPAFGLAVLAALMGDPNLAALFVGLWAVVAVAAGWWLLTPVDRLLEQRRENLLFVAAGR